MIIERAGGNPFGFRTHGVGKEPVHRFGGRVINGGYTLIIAIDLSDGRGLSVGSSSPHRQARALPGRQQIKIASDDPRLVLVIQVRQEAMKFVHLAVHNVSTIWESV